MSHEYEDQLIHAAVTTYPRAKALNLSNNGLHSLTGLEALAETLIKIDLSKNNLKHLRPLSHLTKLVELNLEQNSINELGGLASLSNLEVLNLRGNNIREIDDLAALAHMPRLHTIFLAGNPVESRIGFPEIVLQLQPALQCVDFWRRAPATEAAGAARAPVQLATAEGSAEEQNEALNTAFSLQEQALEANGRELASLCASLTPSPVQTAAGDRQIPEAQLMEQFPYFRLLQLWRKQALDCTMQRTFAEQQLRQSVAAHKEERRQLQERLRAEEARVLACKQQRDGEQRRVAALQQALQARDAALTEVTARAERAESQLAALQCEMKRTNQYLALFKREADQRAVAHSATVLRATEKLARYEERVAAAAERVAFAAAIVAQREVTVRNNLAIVSAERRMLAHIRETAPASADVNATAKAQGSAAEEFQLSAEAESYLLAVFNALDPHDSGRVSVQLLRDCLFELCDSTEEGGVEPAAVAVQATPTGCDVAAALGQALWDNLSQSLLNCLPAEADLTWAEVLLHLLPCRDRTSASTDSAVGLRRTTLSVQDLRGLRRDGLLGDAGWGVLPLQLPPSGVSGRGTSTATRAIGGAGQGPASQAEVARLRLERAFLQERLQHMGRTLERRAEEIRAYFEASINREKLVAERSSLQLSEAERALTEQRARVAELEQRLQESQEKYRTRVPQLQDQVQELQEAAKLRESEAVQRCRLALAAEAEKVTTLEAQILQLSNAATKKDVKVKSLERQVAELTRTQTSRLAELDRLREQLVSREAELHTMEQASAAASEAKAVWDGERGVLAATVAELQRSVDTVQAEVTAKDTELRRLQAIEEAMQVTLQEALKDRKALNSLLAAQQPGAARMDGQQTDGDRRAGPAAHNSPQQEHTSQHPGHHPLGHRHQHQAQYQQQQSWGEDEQKAAAASTPAHGSVSGGAVSAAREAPRTTASVFARLEHLMHRTEGAHFGKGQSLF